MKPKIETTDHGQEKPKKTYTYRPLSELNVIDNFLFTTLLTREGSKEKVARLILNSILGKQFRHVTVTAQREYPGIDTDRHGIRLDVSITDDEDDAVVYDLEPDNNSSVSLYNCIYFVRRQNYLMQDV